jgi:predicted nucleotidyltransferase
MSVLDEKQEEIAAFCEVNGIEYLGVFGSYARGDYGVDSDIDFIVRFAKRISLFELVRVQRSMGELLGKEVDLITEKSVHKLLRPYIEKDLTAIYERQ